MSLAAFYQDLTERSRRAIRVAGYVLLGFLAFVLTLYLSFPWRKASDRIELALDQATGMDVSIGTLGPSFWPGITMRDVLLRSRPVRPEEKPVTLRIDRLTLHPGILAALSGESAASFSVHAGEGSLDGRVAVEPKRGSELHLVLDGVKLDKVQGLAELDGVPLGGPPGGTIDLSLPLAGPASASGTIALTCDGCTVGDGVAKVKLPGAFGQAGFTLPRIRLGTLTIDVPIKQGLVTFKTFHAQSTDGELFVQGSIALANPLADSRVQLYIRFKLDPALVAKEGSLQFLMSTMGPGKRPDGFYGEKLFGTFRTPRMMPAVDDSAGPSSVARSFGVRPPPIMRPVRPMALAPPVPPPMPTPPAAVAAPEPPMNEPSPSPSPGEAAPDNRDSPEVAPIAPPGPPGPTAPSIDDRER